MFRLFDGTGRRPRDVQVQFLSWLKDNWNSSNIFAISAPIAIGKSAIARAIQIATGAVVLAPENVLVRQAMEMYPDLNYLIGRKHYNCHKDPSVSCEDRHLLGPHNTCTKCAYSVARRRALAGEATIYNPISYYYASLSPNWSPPEVIVVDEYHKLNNMLKLLTGEDFGPTYKPPLDMEQVEVVDWLKEQEDKFLKIVMLSNEKQRIQYNMTLQKIRRVRQGIIENPDQYYHEYAKDGSLVVNPITPPRSLKARLLRCKKLVIMSASLYKSDLDDLVEGSYKYLELESPIPEERRRILFDPGPVNFNWTTPPELVAQWIKRIISKYPNRNTMVHVSYCWSKKLKDLLPGTYTNTSENKTEVFNKFKKKGGIWLASGCAEGLDLCDDLCTLNIIPLLPRANIMDIVVRRQLSTPKGVKEYDLNTIRTVQQMAGRSTRNENDYSTVVLADRSFISLVDKYKEELPKSFIEQIRR